MTKEKTTRLKWTIIDYDVYVGIMIKKWSIFDYLVLVRIQLYSIPVLHHFRNVFGTGAYPIPVFHHFKNTHVSELIDDLGPMTPTRSTTFLLTTYFRAAMELGRSQSFYSKFYQSHNLQLCHPFRSPPIQTHLEPLSCRWPSS